MSQFQSFGALGVSPPRRIRPQGILVYITVMVTIYVVASLALSVTAYLSSQHNARTIEQLQRGSQQLQRGTQQLQRDTNHNLCEQQAYSQFATCAGN